MSEPTTLYCYAHPNRETTLRCKRCERPICVACAVSTPTGYMCKDCVRERQKTFDTALAQDFILGFIIAAALSAVASFLATFVGSIGWIGWILIFIGAPIAGGIIAEAVRAATKRRRSRALFLTVGAGVIVGALPMIFIMLFSQNLFGLIYQGVYLFVAAPTVYARLSGIQLSR